MQIQLGICIFFRGTGSSETSWVVVLLVAPFPSVGHGQAHVSEASSLVLVLQEPSAEVWLRSAAVGGHPSLGRRQAAPQSRRREKAARRFHKRKSKRGRPTGWRKTTPIEDKCVLESFFRVRRPLGSAVNSREVHGALPDPLRRRICQKTVANRLAEKMLHLAGEALRGRWR